MMKHSILSSILFAALLLGCSKEAKQNNVAERTIKIQTGTLQEHTFREIFRAQGMVQAARKGTISAYVPGKIDKIYFEEGSSSVSWWAMRTRWTIMPSAPSLSCSTATRRSMGAVPCRLR